MPPGMSTAKPDEIDDTSGNGDFYRQLNGILPNQRSQAYSGTSFRAEERFASMSLVISKAGVEQQFFALQASVSDGQDQRQINHIFIIFQKCSYSFNIM